MGDNDLHAHPGRCDPNSSVSDREVWRETRLCVDAERFSPGLPAVWFCLESTLLTPLSSDPGDRRRYSVANGDDLVVPGLSPGGAWNSHECDGGSTDDRA